MRRRSTLLIAGGALALLIAAKFLFLLAENDFDISQAPVAFLLPMLVLIIGVVLAAAGRRSGVVMVGLVALLLLPVFVNAVIQRGLAQQNAPDTVMVFAGIPLAIVALVASFALMTGTTKRGGSSSLT
jgi:hypothetical protein